MLNTFSVPANEVVASSSRQIKPRRPLSAYNLFYRYKRSKVLEARARGADSKEAIERVILAPTGREDGPCDDDELRRRTIRASLLPQLSPKDRSARSHRRSRTSAARGEALTFLELSRMMVASWKTVDDYARGVFEELAEEGRKAYKERVAEYERSRPAVEDERKRKEPSEEPEMALSATRTDVVVPNSLAREVSLQSIDSVPSTPTNKYFASATPGGPAKKPKRPLSAYNLFYRYKRSKIMEAIDIITNDDNDLDASKSKEIIDRMIQTTPGLENHPSIAATLSAERVEELRRTEVRQALRDNLFPRESKSSSDGTGKSSPNRKNKNHPDSGFFDMNKSVVAAWKALDGVSKHIFEELANEGKRVFKQRMREYKKACHPSAALKSKKRKTNHVPSYESESDVASSETLRASEPGVGHPLPTATVSPTLTIHVGSMASVAPKKEAKDTGGKEPKPKRPLSAYNLFFRYKRTKILAAHNRGDDAKEAIDRIITASSGLEERPSAAGAMSTEQLEEHRRAEIRAALKDNLCPKDRSARSHRKSHGSVSFLEMNRRMVASWKAIDAVSRGVLEELAAEGRRLYQARVAEYMARHPDTSEENDEDNAPVVSPRTSAFSSAATTAAPIFGRNDLGSTDLPLFPDSLFAAEGPGHEPLLPVDLMDFISDAASSIVDAERLVSGATSSVEPLEPSTGEDVDPFDDEFHHLPFAHVEEHREAGGGREAGGASADDFMRLISTLDV